MNESVFIHLESVTYDRNTLATSRLFYCLQIVMSHDAEGAIALIARALY